MTEEDSGEAGARPAKEIDAFLEEHRRAYWVTLRRDGSPTAHPMAALYEDGRLLFTSYRKSAKNRNAERDPRTCVLAVNEFDASPVKAVTVKGVAEILEGAEPPRKLLEQAGDAGADRACAAITAGRRSVIEIVPTETVAFTDRVREV